MKRRNDARTAFAKSICKLLETSGIHGWGGGRDAEEIVRQAARNVMRDAERLGLPAARAVAICGAEVAVAVEGCARLLVAVTEFVARDGGPQ